MASPSVALVRRALPRSADRLDRDRQAAPQVYERLREMITSLGLPPGSTLSRVALADQFGLSSTPIRDALMRLDEEGLVEVFPQYATVVSRIDLKQAEQAHFLRQALTDSGWQLVNDTPLPLVCFTREHLDPATFLAALHRRQIAWMSEARIDGVPVLRACITNFRTTEADIHQIVDEMNQLFHDHRPASPMGNTFNTSSP